MQYEPQSPLNGTMTQLDPLADALAATSITTDNGSDTSHEQPSLKPTKPSFASALRSGQSTTPLILSKEATSAQPPTPLASSGASTPAPPTVASPADELAPVDDTILQAIRKRDDRIFFSQYENQMAAFVRDPSRSELELGAMNAYQRLLIHKCAEQFHLQHQLDRATHSITLSKTPATSHPSALLSLRAREALVQRDGIDPVNAHPAVISLANATSNQLNSSSSSPSASTSSLSSPVPTQAATLSPASGAPKAGFKIMRRDPSNSRQSRLRSTDNDISGSNSDSDKAAAKARKDMTLEEREASYKAARARIFGDLATSGSTSPTSSTSHLDQTKEADQSKDAATSAPNSKPSPTSSAASSPVASIAGGRSGSKKKVSSSASSVASQDGSTQRTRGNGRAKAAHSHASDSNNDDLEFCRNLPMSSNPAFGGPQQSSPLALPGHVTQGYFPPTHPSHLQQSHSNPNLRSRAPVFHPQGSSTPAYSQGGALRYPDMGFQQQAQHQRSWPHPGDSSETDAFPALSSASQSGVSGSRQTQQQNSSRNAQASGSGSRSQPAGQEHLMNGVGAWAQQTSACVYSNAPQRHQQQPQHYSHYPPPQQQQQQYQPGIQPYQMGHPSLAPHYTQLGQGQPFVGPRSATSSRASSQRGGNGMNNHRGARDDAMSVASISSASSSRSASFSGVSAAGSTSQVGNASNKAANGPIPALSHPSLPARPAWLSPNNAE
ncbi:uncharacterized protein UTRI_04513_B [Ustilago trichophora]|uniref:SUZ domain-containing protein n=1 Tax=Ustilago trichophora TaxID=86804 RepID=A0A5C3EBX5_9BASI|nr:uncharacterized protein UTRI_04513_B [Ustilago trichophora]